MWKFYKRKSSQNKKNVAVIISLLRPESAFSGKKLWVSLATLGKRKKGKYMKIDKNDDGFKSQHIE